MVYSTRKKEKSVFSKKQVVIFEVFPFCLTPHAAYAYHGHSHECFRTLSPSMSPRTNYNFDRYNTVHTVLVLAGGIINFQHSKTLQDTN